MNLTIAKNGEYTLLMRFGEDEKPVKCQPYVVAWLYESESDTWAQGHYFDDIKSAVEYLYH